MTRKTRPVFATLGPEGTNHALVTHRYLAFHGRSDLPIVLVDTFRTGLEMLADGRVDHMVQAAAHPQTAAILGEACFRHAVHVVDVFISPSQPLAVVTRRAVTRPRTIGLQPATRSYLDLSAWEEVVEEASIATVAAGLLAGRHDSGIVALHLAQAHPDLFRVDRVLGTVDDPWIVYGREAVCRGDLVASPDGPFARRLRSLPATGRAGETHPGGRSRQ